MGEEWGGAAPVPSPLFSTLCAPPRAWVVVSSSVPGSTTTPLSTLMPGRMPLALSMSTNCVPSDAAWKRVSSNRIWGGVGRGVGGRRLARRVWRGRARPLRRGRACRVRLDPLQHPHSFLPILLPPPPSLPPPPPAARTTPEMWFSMPSAVNSISRSARRLSSTLSTPMDDSWGVEGRWKGGPAAAGRPCRGLPWARLASARSTTARPLRRLRQACSRPPRPEEDRRDPCPRPG